jgi:hypothetical protein
MALPPVLVGAVNVMVVWVSSADAERLVGGSGTVHGVTVVDVDALLLTPNEVTVSRTIV